MNNHHTPQGPSHGPDQWFEDLLHQAYGNSTKETTMQQSRPTPPTGDVPAAELENPVYLLDDGFAAGVVQQLPPPRGQRRRVRLWALALATVAGMAIAALLFPLDGVYQAMQQADFFADAAAKLAWLREQTAQLSPAGITTLLGISTLSLGLASFWAIEAKR